MDYCTSCRRHLNGALVCPGCGAYAPDIAPATIDSRVPSGPTGPTATGPMTTPMPPTTPAAPMVPTLPTAAWGYGAVDAGWHEGPVSDGFAGNRPVSGIKDIDADMYARSDAGPALDGDPDADADVDVDVEGVPVAPQGRAARRRQLARWKKNQRRAVVATAVALVGGGLTVMGMDRQSTDRTQAATAPDAESLGTVEEQGSQGGRTSSATETDDTRRTPDAPTWTPSGDTSRDRSTANRSSSRAHPNSPRTDSATPSAEEARTGSSATADRTPTDGLTTTPTDGTNTPPATDDAGSSADTGSDSGTESGTGTDDGGSGSDSGASDGSSSDTATTSPSGLCLLGLVCVS
ncbi:hypothetical protein F9278_25060 [Streptomyces phaeolivaceus]|uniref:Uncharacterized protein n=2 Tax=Streptomyces phaeolivaceus TaxID=2653200 RepID=A0A5P8KI07_9ACTN|nr:hypothetical protein F9278_25060 [Streptomyces phaeolivaceus]